MIRSGQTLVNPTTGTQLTFRKTAAESNGRLQEIDFLYPAHRGKEGNQPHFHVSFDEQFEVLEGVAAYQMARVEHQARAGEKFVIPRRTVHMNPWNAGEHVLLVRGRTEMEPPDLGTLQATENLFETLAGLARDGKADANGLPRSFLQTALLLQSLQPSSWAAGIPIPVQRILFGALAALARGRGYRTHYPQYDLSRAATA